MTGGSDQRAERDRAGERRGIPPGSGLSAIDDRREAPGESRPNTDPRDEPPDELTGSARPAARFKVAAGGLSNAGPERPRRPATNHAVAGSGSAGESLVSSDSTAATTSG